MEESKRKDKANLCILSYIKFLGSLDSLTTINPMANIISSGPTAARNEGWLWQLLFWRFVFILV